MKAHEKAVIDMAACPADDSLFVTAAEDGTVVVWRFDVTTLNVLDLPPRFETHHLTLVDKDLTRNPKHFVD